jgi:hypothetical protein
VMGDAQALKASRSRRHSKVEPGSLELKVKVADVLDVVPVGPDVIVVCGAAELIVQVSESGVASSLPDGSLAHTLKVCFPSASAGYVQGEEQGRIVCVFRWHLKVEPGSLEANVKVADVLDVVPIGGDVIVVSGATVSIVQAAWAGVGSVPSRPIACTSNACDPSASPV